MCSTWALIQSGPGKTLQEKNWTWIGVLARGRHAGLSSGALAYCGCHLEDPVKSRCHHSAGAQGEGRIQLACVFGGRGAAGHRAAGSGAEAVQELPAACLQILVRKAELGRQRPCPRLTSLSSSEVAPPGGNCPKCTVKAGWGTGTRAQKSVALCPFSPLLYPFFCLQLGTKIALTQVIYIVMGIHFTRGPGG